LSIVYHIKAWWANQWRTEVEKEFIAEKSPIADPVSRVAWLISRHQVKLTEIMAKAESAGLTAEEKQKYREELENARMAFMVFSTFQAYLADQEAKKAGVENRAETSSPTPKFPNPPQIDADPPRRDLDVEER
jgi:hypothetical protein